MTIDQVFDKNFQDNVIHALITDDEFLSYAQVILPVESFLSPIARKLVESVYRFHKDYDAAPKEHIQSYFLQLTQAGAFTETDGEICRKYLSEISHLTPNPRYLLKVLSNWVRRQAVKGALLESAPLIERGTTEDLNHARLLFDKAFDRGAESIELGTELLEIKTLPWRRFEPDFKFHIPELDRAIKGAKRGELVAIHGTPGVGKSWFCIHILRALGLQGENGVYYTGEMTEDDIKIRSTQNFSGTTAFKVERTRLWNMASKSFLMCENPKTVWDISVEQQMKSVAAFGSKLWVKEFISGEFGVDDIEAHLNYMLRTKGFMPLAIIVDYDELLRPSRKIDELRLAILNVFNDLKALALKLNIIVFLPTQSNVQGLDAKLMGMKHLGEAFAKAKPTDLMISLNQSEEEFKEGIMRLFIYKNRNGPRFQVIKIWQNFAIGQFCFHSERVGKELQNGEGE